MTREYREYAKSRIEYLLKISRLDERDKEALEAAIQALSQEPCDDAISQNQSNACSILDDECPYPHKHCWECSLNYQYELAKHELDKNVELPSVTQKPIECDDAISRQAMLDYLKANVDDFPDYHEAIEKVLQMPPVRLKESCDAISRDAVIRDFKLWRGKMAYSIGEDYSGVSVLDKAIRVIKGMPSMPKGQTDDAISRAYIEPIIEELENICVNADEYILNLLADIKNAPPVTHKSGKWIVDLQTATEDYYVCSECGRKLHLIYPDIISNYPYCHCGARMVEPQERSNKE